MVHGREKLLCLPRGGIRGPSRLPQALNEGVQLLFVVGCRASNMYELVSRSWIGAGFSERVSEFVAHIVVVGADP